MNRKPHPFDRAGRGTLLDWVRRRMPLATGFLLRMTFLVGVLTQVWAGSPAPNYLVVISSGVETFEGAAGFQMDASDGGILLRADGTYRVVRGPIQPWPVRAAGLPAEYVLATPNVLGRYADGAVRLFGPLKSGAGSAAEVIAPPGPLTLRSAGWMGTNLLVLQTDGTVMTWNPGGTLPGSTTPLPLKPVEGVSGVVSLAVGTDHAVGLRSDGTVVAWGTNRKGQTQVPPGLRNVVSVGAGYQFSAALQKDGRLVLWGDFPEPPDPLPPLQSFAVGYWQFLALGVDGSILGWGGNMPQILKSARGLKSVLALGASISAGAFLVPGQPPVFLKEPAHRLFSVGERLTLEVSVIDFGPTRYQWFHNDVAIPGETNSTLTRYFAGSRQEGTYTVAASNRYGTRVSNPARFQLTDTLLLEPGSPGPADVPRPELLGPVRGAVTGRSHTVALRPDGTVSAWGGNGSGQCNVPTGLRDVVAMAAGGEHTLALRSDGTVVAWGANDARQCNVPADLQRVTAVAAGLLHSIVLQADGTVRAWGSQGFAEPAALRAITNAIAVGAGQEYSAVLQRDGTVSVFAAVFQGLLDPPPDLGPVRAIAAGSRHMAALQEDGRLRIWGDNSRGQTAVPANLTGIQTIAAGGDSTLVQLTDGTVKLIGTGSVILSNTRNVRSMATAGDRSAFVVFLPPNPFPPQLVRLPDPQMVSPGQQILLDVEVDGTPVLSYTWYRNGRQIGRGRTLNLEANVDSGGLYTVKVSNAYGEFTSAEIPMDVVGIPAGRTVGWGPNRGFPVRATFDTHTVRSLSVGNNFMVASKQDGSVEVRGDGGRGQTNVPPGLGRVVSVAAGDGHVLVLTDDGRVQAWGDNSRGQCDVPTLRGPAVAIAAGWQHSLAALADGTVVGWGDNSHGETRPPVGLGGVSAIAAGMDFSVALRNNGTLVAWGDRSRGQTTPFPAERRIVSIVAGAQHGLALLDDGNVMGWGRNDAGQAPQWPGVNDAVSIAAADHYSMAIRQSGEVVLWGAYPTPPANLLNDLRGATRIAAGRYQAVAVLPPPRVRSFLEWEGERLKVKSWVSPGWQYQYEESTDLENWYPSGPAFLAPGAVLSDEVGLAAGSAYFRLRAVP